MMKMTILTVVMAMVLVTMATGSAINNQVVGECQGENGCPLVPDAICRTTTMLRYLTKAELDAQFVLSIIAILGNLLVMVGVSIKTSITKTYFTYLREFQYAVRQYIIQRKNFLDEVKYNQIYDKMYQNTNLCSKTLKSSARSNHQSFYQMSNTRTYFWNTLLISVLPSSTEMSLRDCWDEHYHSKFSVCRLNEESVNAYTEPYVVRNQLTLDTFRYFIQLFQDRNSTFNEMIWKYTYYGHTYQICVDCLFEILKRVILHYPGEGLDGIRESLQIVQMGLRNFPQEEEVTMVPGFQSDSTSSFEVSTKRAEHTTYVMIGETRTSSLIQGIVNGIIPSLMIIILVVVDILKTNSQTKSNKKSVNVPEQGTEQSNQLRHRKTEPSKHSNTEDGPTFIPLHRLNICPPLNFEASTSFMPIAPSAPTVEPETVFEPDSRYTSLPFTTPQNCENPVEEAPSMIFEPNPEYVSYPVIATEKPQLVSSVGATMTSNFDDPPRYCDIEPIGIFNIEGELNQKKDHPQHSMDQSTVTPDRDLSINLNDSFDQRCTQSYRNMVGNHIATTMNGKSQTVTKSNVSNPKCPMWTAIRIMSVLRDCNASYTMSCC
ncbi:hypothetical protein LOTGIDRAFT_236840 [Lottia gigantea]|uniref:Uncharacterized protein n=1 Tax=Lottia gigantea TaxID=225164 RepID=V3ZKX7_LOTGI|nr:hypothetical protein LOTGIDRAFT_236840 [Lottia gigantea]ESO83055.1 hypothetical protein LOTGIDRAFT_236840 [Lottia gigantea]